MLRLTKKADYSLIALRHFAFRQQQTGGAVSAKEVSDVCGIPLPVLSKLLQKLGKSGFLVSEYGTNGGYRLARHPSRISALEVIRAIDGPVVLTSCFTEHSGLHKSCNTSAMCTVREPLRRVHEAMLGLLEKFTIAELAADGRHPIQIGGVLNSAKPVKTEFRHDEAYIPG